MRYIWRAASACPARLLIISLKQHASGVQWSGQAMLPAVLLLRAVVTSPLQERLAIPAKR